MSLEEHQRIALIELHDARIEKIEIEPGETAVIEFKHLPLYVEIDSELFEVWSYRAKLQMEGVKYVEIKDSISECDYIMDGEIFDADQKRVQPLTPDSMKLAKMIQLSLGYGATVHFRFTGLTLVLISAIRKLEESRGPLLKRGS